VSPLEETSERALLVRRLREGYADARDPDANDLYVQFPTVTLDRTISDYHKAPGPINTSWYHCVEVEWPAPHVWVTRDTRNRSLNGPLAWMGTLIDGMRDNSGQMYMRNRYYDPASGRFTQEDPIGLAGGLNAYGFVGGDPVSYSDPYGLSCWDTNGKEIPCPTLNYAALALIQAIGGLNRTVPLGVIQAHQTRGYEGLQINAVGRTGFALGVNPQSGNAAIGFTGKVFFTASGVPDATVLATFERGGFDLGTGAFFAEGFIGSRLLNHVTIWGNANTDEGHLEVCGPSLPIVGKRCDRKDFSLNQSNPLNAVVRANRDRERKNAQ